VEVEVMKLHFGSSYLHWSCLQFYRTPFCKFIPPLNLPPVL